MSSARIGSLVKTLEVKDMLGKVLFASIMGMVTGYLAYTLHHETTGNTPIQIPLAAWLFITLFTLWLLKE